MSELHPSSVLPTNLGERGGERGDAPTGAYEKVLELWNGLINVARGITPVDPSKGLSKDEISNGRERMEEYLRAQGFPLPLPDPTAQENEQRDTLAWVYALARWEVELMRSCGYISWIERGGRHRHEIGRAFDLLSAVAEYNDRRWLPLIFSPINTAVQKHAPRFLAAIDKEIRKRREKGGVSCLEDERVRAAVKELMFEGVIEEVLKTVAGKRWSEYIFSDVLSAVVNSRLEPEQFDDLFATAVESARELVRV